MPTDTVQDPVEAEIGERLHLWMWRNRVSQADLARLLLMTQSSLSRKLRGVSPWTAGEALRVTRALEVSIGWLYGETEEEPARPKGLEPLTFWSVLWRARRRVTFGLKLFPAVAA